MSRVDPDFGFLTISELTSMYRARAISPVEVTRSLLAKIERLDPSLHAYVTVCADLALEQAHIAEQKYGASEHGPLLGIPLSIKDIFHVAGQPSGLGSRVFAGQSALEDSGVPRRLRQAGAVFLGKTATAEFAQSATTENRVGHSPRNPWATARTPGGSSGGAAVSVAAGMATVAVGSDSGGSLRIPAAFTGLVGYKPSHGLCADERGFRAMSDFASPGPIGRSIEDVRTVLETLAGKSMPRRSTGRGLQVALCADPEGRPIVPDMTREATRAASLLAAKGAEVSLAHPPTAGWQELFAVLVLAEEHRERGHLRNHLSALLTEYERRTLEAATNLEPQRVLASRREVVRYRRRMQQFLARYDVLITPTVAVPAFELGRRPRAINGTVVDRLWGAFPFTAAYNVARTCAVSLPVACTTEGLPVAVQLVAGHRKDHALLDIAQDLAEAVSFDRSPAAANVELVRQSR
jgi:Asp-tRNAAsn/Glu-tRNAGln amidotransferase A subunit and related amidases